MRIVSAARSRAAVVHLVDYERRPGGHCWPDRPGNAGPRDCAEGRNTERGLVGSSKAVVLRRTRAPPRPRPMCKKALGCRREIARTTNASPLSSCSVTTAMPRSLSGGGLWGSHSAACSRAAWSKTSSCEVQIGCLPDAQRVNQLPQKQLATSGGERESRGET
jgi:hypothetical protein